MLHGVEIGVKADDGVVNLTGTVDNAKRLEGEDAGVKGVVEKIDVKSGNLGEICDNEIAPEVLKAMKWEWQAPNDKVKVEGGWIALAGELTGNNLMVEATPDVSNLEGVKGVINNINIKSETHDAIEQKYVEGAFKRNWSINASDINVKVSGTKVTLSGTVRSCYQKEEARRIALQIPGIWAVENKLQVEYDF